MGLINKKISTKTPIRYIPKNKEELRRIIIDLLRKGIKDLKYIDVSGVENMSFLFSYVNDIVPVKYIDISEWNVSNVKDMIDMFKGCEKFNSYLSNWDVSKVKYMDEMFNGCTTLIENKLIPAWYKFN